MKPDPSLDFWIDEPADWNSARRYLRVAGWCVAKSAQPVRAVRARIGGRIFPGHSNLERTDVAEHLGLTSAASACGFVVDLRVPFGVHLLELQVARDNDDWKTIATYPVRGPFFANASERAAERERRAAAARAFRFWFYPRPETWPHRLRDLRLEGWCFASDGDPILELRARVGGKIFPAHYGILRPDVALAHDRQPGSLRSGFSIDLIVPWGRHRLILEARGPDGFWQEFFAKAVSGFLFRGGDDVLSPIGNYPAWIRSYDTLTRADRTSIRREIAQLQRRPTISILLPTYNSDPHFLRRAIESVRAQIYREWQLCAVDDASSDPRVWQLLQDFAHTDPRIKIQRRGENGNVSAASNDALAVATGEYVALLDHDDELAPTALFFVARELNRATPPLLIYSDEDKLDRLGRRYDPNFKPDWNPDLFLAQNYFSHLGIFATELVRQVGGFRRGFEGAQDYDLTLRCLEQIEPERIAHVPHVLYHWRSPAESTAAFGAAKPHAIEAAVRAVQEHLDRSGISAQVVAHRGSYQRVIYPPPPDHPLVSLIIPTRDRGALLRACVESIFAKTAWRNFELVLVDNETSEPQAREFLDSLGDDARVRILREPGEFNFSALNNRGVAQARGQFVCLLNNDLEVMHDDWLGEMLSQAVRPGVGAVGARLWYPNGTIQHAGVILGAGGIGSHAHAGLKEGPGYFSRAHLVQNFSAVTAACLLTRKEIYLQLGGLDETNLPVAFNDVDFCLRLRAAGYRIVWTPFAELVHHESASRGFEDTAEKRARFLAEAAYMEKKWGAELAADPAYNPNLSLGERPFTLAIPPRASKPWRHS
ncbi:MAG: glycosyltransferase family 2 protein [Verrucomicrobiota bacterium]|nr:glycosyltransferase family 2 protein [Verrucomicrobiota bacterium]